MKAHHLQKTYLLFLLVLGPLVVAATKRIHHDDSLSDYFMEILQVPIPFANKEDEEKCETIVDELTEEEIQVAARTSYAYWFLEQSGSCPPASLQKSSAIREARRHLIAANGNIGKALGRLQEACQYRKDHQLDSLRICFDDAIALEETTTRLQGHNVAGDMEKQTVVMRGQDRDARAVLIKFPRKVGGVTEEEYLTTQIYVAERANACTEFVSRGRQETITAIFDFSSYDSSHSPPMKWQLSAIRTLQHLYPERLHKLVILDPPFWMRGLFRGIRPFLSGTTRHKIELVTDRTKVFEDWNDAGEEESRRLLTEQLTQPVDVNRYLKDIPFYCPYNCKDYLPNNNQIS